jgi:hypothetical protein
LALIVLALIVIDQTEPDVAVGAPIVLLLAVAAVAFITGWQDKREARRHHAAEAAITRPNKRKILPRGRTTPSRRQNPNDAWQPFAPP